MPLPQETAGAGLNFINPVNVKTDILDFYDTQKYEHTANPYSETRFEPSPASRPLEQAAPGNSWALDPNTDTDHTVKTAYQFNREDDAVKHFRVSFPTGNTEEPQLNMLGYFEAHELIRSVVMDENWTPETGDDHTSIEFTNKLGQVVLSRGFDAQEAHDTYYVYDDFGNLTYVVPPKAADILVTANSFKAFDPQYINAYEFWSTRMADNGSTSGGVAVALDGNLLTVAFEISIQTQSLRNGVYGKAMPLPDMELGTMFPDGQAYDVSIVDGYLYVSGEGNVSLVQHTFTVTIPEYGIDQEVFENLCYEYHYDHRNRVVQKRTPGKDWEYIVYNKRDLPVLVQDGNMREQGQWLFTKYDNLGRLVYTGMYTTDPCTSITSGGKKQSTEKWNKDEQEESPENFLTLNHCGRTSLQQFVNQTSALSESKTTGLQSFGGMQLYYTNNSFPDTDIEVLTINYYDDYAFDWNVHPQAINPAGVEVYGQQLAGSTRGLATGSKVKVLEQDAWITTYTVYDHDAAPVWIASANSYLETFDVVKSHLDFVGTVQESEAIHQKEGQETITTIDYFTYDHQLRLLDQKQQINDGELQLIAHHTYDELGRVVAKKVGGATTLTEDFSLPTASGLQDIDLSYTIRGWLKGINDIETAPDISNKLFNFKINYNTVETSFTLGTPLYNGNISETLWRTAGPESEVKGYRYTYDAMNRLKEARFVNKAGTSYYTSRMTYRERVNKYDKNGNILALYRTGGLNDQGQYTVWDNLDYSYTGNQLSAVREKTNGFRGNLVDTREEGFFDGNTSGTDYAYDKNGNQTSDANKGINGIVYNHLNLPVLVTVNGTSAEGTEQGTISYIYDAVGVKLQKQVSETGNDLVTSYAGGYIYETTASEGEQLKFFSHPEGYFDVTGTSSLGELEGDYVFQYTDHLGNVRLSYKDANGDGSIDAATEIVEENHYYPFGLKHKNYNNNVTSSNPALDFKYNGVEQEKALGVNFYEMDLRQYDPAIGRWTGIDPVTHHSYSTYSAFDNNPIYYADPSGADAVDGAAIGGNGGVSHSSVQGMLAADGAFDWGSFHGSYVTGSDPYRNTTANSLGGLDLYSHLSNINEDQEKNDRRIKEKERSAAYWKAYFKLAASEFNFFVKSGGLSLTGQPPASFGDSFTSSYVGTFASIKSFFGGLLDNPLKTIDTAIRSSIEDGSIANAIPIVASFNALRSKGESLANIGGAIASGDNATAGQITGGMAAGLTIDVGVALTTRYGAGLFGSITKNTSGGLNLFKWGAPQTTGSGWRVGDYFLNLPNMGTPRLNWKANYGALRREMGRGRPIFDSYRSPNGNLIPTGGFLNAERYILYSRGWRYTPSLGAWLPPR